MFQRIMELVRKKRDGYMKKGNPLNTPNSGKWYRAVDIAKYILTKCTKDGVPISNLQLQKILYYIQAYSLKHQGPMLQESFYAWKFGPVIPEVYFLYCGYGASTISGTYPTVDIDAADQAAIDAIVEEKRELPPWDLVEDTHRKGGAWDKVYQDGKGDRHVIRNDKIKDDENIG